MQRQLTWLEEVSDVLVLDMNYALCHEDLCDRDKEPILDLLEKWEPTERCHRRCNMIEAMDRNFLC